MRGKCVVALSVAGLVWAGSGSAAGSPWTGRYVVRAGDSLTAIAQRYRVSFQSLAAANGLDWQRPLLIGVTLDVPSGGASAGATYVVRAGDTLSGIALRYHVSLSELARANGLDASGLLLIGTRLRIPSGGASLDLAHIVEANPYAHGTLGYDVSYPNCLLRVSGESAFGVIGLNLGRPFTANPCFDSEWTAARAPSVYINTAYSPTLLRHVTPECTDAARSRLLRLAARRAYAVGCSEAVAALRLLGARAPAAIWLDVEPDNTWSSRRMLNAVTIKGILEHLLAYSNAAIGVYSNTGFWQQIAGGWSSLAVPEWIASGAPDPPGCPLAFAAGPVWLSQSTDGRLDSDAAC